MSRNRQTRIEQLENAGRLITAQKQRIAELEAEAASKAHIKSYEHPLSAEDARGLFARIQSLEAELDHYKHMYENAEAAGRHLKISRDELAALNVSGVNLGEVQAERRFNERLQVKVAALTEVLKLAMGMLNAASGRLGFSESAIAKDVKADIEYVLREINKRALGE